MNGKPTGGKSTAIGVWWQWLILVVLLGGTLSVLCRDGFKPFNVQWQNDGSLAECTTSASHLPECFKGHWMDINWIGIDTASNPINISSLMGLFLTPKIEFKYYTPMCMFLLGFSAWLFFRQLRFSGLACIVGGLAAGLNMHFFSVGCWGLEMWILSTAMTFLALAAIVSDKIRQIWARGIFAGFCVGLSVMEGFDVGAIYSVLVGLFVFFFFLITEKTPATRICKGVGVGVLVVLASFYIAAATLTNLVGTQITGIVGTGQTEQEKAAHWDFATQWSMPKLETLRIVIPGVFGYRMYEFTTSTNKAGSYWGWTAEDPNISKLRSSDPELRFNTAKSLGAPPEVQNAMKSGDQDTRNQIIHLFQDRMQRRHSGSGDYTGVLVVLLAFFALANSFRRVNQPFTLTERRILWFFALAAAFSMLATWGRYSFLYQWLYKIPYFSVIRNPIKFLHPLNVLLIILCGFGVEALYRGYLANAAERTASLPGQVMQWWGKAGLFERLWSLGCVAVIAVSLVSFWVLRTSIPELIHYIEVEQGFDANHSYPAELSTQMAHFCCSEVGWFVIFLAASVAVIYCVMSGAWTAQKSWPVWALLCAITICDLSRSDIPWIRYFNYNQKYSMNPIVDVLRQHPHDYRVVGRLSPVGAYDIAVDGNFGALLHWWLENDFPYNDIEDLEIDQWPRMPQLDSMFLGAFQPRYSGNNLAQADLRPVTRMWQLTSTRYILAGAEIVSLLNGRGDPIVQGYHILKRFNMVPKPGITHIEDAGDLTAQLDDQGPYALIELDHVLPRVKLFSYWGTAPDDPKNDRTPGNGSTNQQPAGNDISTLETILQLSFDPQRVVMLAKDTPVSQQPSAAPTDPGTVSIADYKPMHITCQADAKTGSILMMTDRYSGEWKAFVDGASSPLLRCDHIFRGVFVPAGSHKVEFRYEPPVGMLYVSLSAWIVGILLSGFLVYSHYSHKSAAPAAEPEAAAAPPPKPKRAS